MLYGEPYDQSMAESMNLPDNRWYWDQYYVNDPDSRWVNYIPTTLWGAFNEEFISYSYGTVKLYSLDYTMLEQFENKTSANWVPSFNRLSSMSIDGNITGAELNYKSYDVVLGGGYDAKVYTNANSTHMYFGVKMENYTIGEDAFGIQIAPLDAPEKADLRIVNYDGNAYYDGHVDYYGDWAEDTDGANSQEYATNGDVIEFLIPLNSGDSQDINLQPGMNYQVKFMFWNNVDHGEPTLDSDWLTFWVPVELH